MQLGLAVVTEIINLVIEGASVHRAEKSYLQSRLFVIAIYISYGRMSDFQKVIILLTGALFTGEDLYARQFLQWTVAYFFFAVSSELLLFFPLLGN